MRYHCVRLFLGPHLYFAAYTHGKSWMWSWDRPLWDCHVQLQRGVEVRDPTPTQRLEKRATKFDMLTRCVISVLVHPPQTLELVLAYQVSDVHYDIFRDQVPCARTRRGNKSGRTLSRGSELLTSALYAKENSAISPSTNHPSHKISVSQNTTSQAQHGIVHLHLALTIGIWEDATKG